MTEVTLSSAVRSNLLSLQTTADMMSKTQERLATGLKVNSALDNPTNFFTASSLNSRASDLGRLMDGVSNAKQTLEAADNGLSAITTLVESAQATARQALQTPATIDAPVAATPGVFTGGGFSALDLSGGVGPALAARYAGSTYTNLDLTTTGFLGTTARITTSGSGYGSPNAVDLSSANSVVFDIEVDGSTPPTQITIDAAAVSQLGTVSNINDVSQAEFVDLLNQEFSDAGLGVTARSVGVGLNFETDVIGADQSMRFTSVGGVGGAASNSAMASIDGTFSQGLDPDPTGVYEFVIDVDDTGPQTITIDQNAINQFNAGPGSINTQSSVTGAEFAQLINQELTEAGVDASVSFGSNTLLFTSNSVGASSEIDIVSITDDTSGGVAGLSTGETTGLDERIADFVEFSVSVDGGPNQSIRIGSIDAIVNPPLDQRSLDADDLVLLINQKLDDATASVDETTGGISITSDTQGEGSSIAITGYDDDVSGGFTGMSDGSARGSALSTTPILNPARAEFVTQYNEIMAQIDELAEDAGFNGVNLLDGDDLSVIFNEDGSSNLSIAGRTFDATGLGLGQLMGTGLDSDTAINTTLGALDATIGTLRAQASEFGSNLSIVETREDFTKNMVNTLETGAANLTLADTNEEGANLLALQTRQSLSSTALSLASQADQNVLRLF